MPKKFLDANGVQYLASLMQDYPDNQLLGTIINAIGDELEGKENAIPVIVYTHASTNCNMTYDEVREILANNSPNLCFVDYNGVYQRLYPVYNPQLPMLSWYSITGITGNSPSLYVLYHSASSIFTQSKQLALKSQIPAATTISQVLTSGTEIAQINGTSIYAPAGSGEGGSIDLSNYYTKVQIDDLNAAIQNALEDKIDKTSKVILYNKDSIQVDNALEGDALSCVLKWEPSGKNQLLTPNLIDPELVSEGYYLNAQGGMTGSNGDICSDYIPAEPHQMVTFYGITGKTGSVNRRFHAYDANKKWISQMQLYTVPANDTTRVWHCYVETPTNTAYIRGSWSDVDTDMMIQYGEFTEYQPYKYGKLFESFDSFELILNNTSSMMLELDDKYYCGEIDVVNGKFYENFGQIKSYTDEDLTKTYWLSDSDDFVYGTNPSAGSFVLYQLENPIEHSIATHTIPLTSGLNTLTVVNAFFKEFSYMALVALGGSGGSSITIDSALSASSTNPVANNVITKALNELSSSSGSSITVDSSLSSSSTNPVQNKVIYEALQNIDSGDITVDTDFNKTSTNPIQNKTLTSLLFDDFPFVYTNNKLSKFKTIERHTIKNTNGQFVHYFNDFSSSNTYNYMQTGLILIGGYSTVKLLDPSKKLYVLQDSSNGYYITAIYYDSNLKELSYQTLTKEVDNNVESISLTIPTNAQYVQIIVMSNYVNHNISKNTFEDVSITFQ